MLTCSTIFFQTCRWSISKCSGFTYDETVTSLLGERNEKSRVYDGTV